MSRFVRASKYRHVFGQAAKKEYCVDNVKVSNSAWDTNLVACSASYISINWNASGGGAFAILPLPSPFQPHPLPHKLPDVIPLARGHTAPVLDTAWSPHDDSVVASAGDDGHILLWKVRAEEFENWGAEKWVPHDFDPVSRINASARKVGQVEFHPTARHVLAGATGDHVVKIWDLSRPDEALSTLSGQTDTIQSIAFSFNGSLLVTTCRDRKLRLFDARAGGDPVRVGVGHGGIKGARVLWMGDTDRIATTGFSKMSERQVAIWDTGSLKSVKTVGIDQSSGVMMPFYSDNSVLFLAGKGDGNVRYYEYESDTLYPLSEYQSSSPQRGMCFLPRRALNVSECEIARAYKISGTAIEPISFVVPRKSDSFQSDIYPPALSAEPSLTADEFFSGKTAPPNLVSLENGAIYASSSAPPPSSSSSSKLAAAPEHPTPTRTSSAPAPSPGPAPAPVKKQDPPSKRQTDPPPPTPAHESKASPTSPKRASPTAQSAPETKTQPTPISRSQSAVTDASDISALQDDNERLNVELREARAHIRNLELQVEGLKANAQRAARALLETHQ